MKKVILKIDGMRCGMCETHINNIVRTNLTKVKKVKSNHHNGEATFVVDDDVNYQSVIDGITKDGYRVLEQKDEPYVGFSLFHRK